MDTMTLWDQALEDLRSRIDRESFSTYLEPVRMVERRGDTFVLGVPSEFNRSMLRSYLHQLEDALSELIENDAHIEVTIDQNETAGGEDLGDGFSESERRALHVQSQLPGSPIVHCPLNQNFTFDSFVVGESNRFAHAAAQAVSDPHSMAYNPLFIYGGVGLGKTHLMQAIGHKMRSYGEHINVLYVSSEAFMNTFIDAVAQKRLSEFRNCFRNVDLLLVDDVQFFANAERTQAEFFHTFNSLFDAGKKIVLSSDQQPSNLQQLEERLVSRFECGLIVDVQPPDLETRVAILREKAEASGVRLSDEVSIYIAERVKRNLRKLQGALTKLSAHALMNDEVITIEMARQLLGPFFSGEEHVKVTIEKIQKIVCDFFDISVMELTGANRSRQFARPRQIACYLCREMTNSSFPEIARKFGGRDHTSIMHGYRKIQKDMVKDPDLQNRLKYLMKTIKDGPGR